MALLRRLLCPLVLVALGLAPWLTGPPGQQWSGIGLSASAWAVLRLFAAIPALLGAGLIAGELFGTDSQSLGPPEHRSADNAHVITGSPRFVTTVFVIIGSLLLSAWAGRATETGPDVLGTTLVPTMGYAGLLVSAIWLAAHIERCWAIAPRRQRVAGLLACTGAVMAIPLGILLFSFLAHAGLTRACTGLAALASDA